MAISVGNLSIHAKITSEDVRLVRVFVTEGLKLPTDVASIEKQFGYSSTTTASSVGVSAADLMPTFVSIHDHAKLWGAIEKDIQRVSASLSTFSADLDLYMTPAVNEIKKMKGYEDYTLKVKDLTSEQVDKFVMKVDGPEFDTKHYPTIVEYLEAIESSIEEKRKAATSVKASLGDFRDGLVRVEEDLGGKLKKVSSTKVIDGLRELNSKIDELADKISELQKPRYYNFFEWCEFIATFGAAVVQKKLEEFEKEIAPLIRELNRKKVQRKELDALSGVLGNVHISLFSLKIYTAGAIEGVTQIDTLWGATIKEIVDSKAALNKPEDWKFLLQFVTNMESVLESWKSIKKNIDDLRKAIEQN